MNVTDAGDVAQIHAGSPHVFFVGDSSIVRYSIETERCLPDPAVTHYVTSTSDGQSGTFVHTWTLRCRHDTCGSSMTAIDRSAVKQRLQQFETLGENWDGYGADTVSHACLANAIALIDALPPNVESPDVFPNPNGTVTFEWQGPSGTLSIEFGENGISVFHDYHGQVSFYQDTYDEGLAVIVASTTQQFRSNLAIANTSAL